jgi:hypothetical protein
MRAPVVPVSRRRMIFSLLGIGGTVADRGTQARRDLRGTVSNSFLSVPAIGTSVAPKHLRLLSTAGLAMDQILFATGFFERGDGGGGIFFWDASSIAADDGGLVICPANHEAAGRWRRLFDEGLLNAKWFGARGDGQTTDTASVRLALAALPVGGHLYFPAGTYSITETIIIPQEKNGIRLHGRGRGPADPSSTPASLQWACKKPEANSWMFDVRAYDVTFESLRFAEKLRSAARGFVQLRAGGNSLSHRSATHMTMDGVFMEGSNYGVAIGYDTPRAGNLEFCRFHDCRFHNQLKAGVIVGNEETAGGNSIGHTFNRCTWSQYLHVAPWGVGVISNGGGPLYFNECNFSHLERGIVCKSNYVSCVSIRNADSENTKRLVDGTGLVSGTIGSANSSSSLIVSGGRIDCDGSQAASCGPTPRGIAASDHAFIKWNGGQIHFDGVQFQSAAGGVVEARIVAAMFARVSANASFFPCQDVFADSDCALSIQACGCYADKTGAVAAMPNGLRYYGAWKSWESNPQFRYASFRADKFDLQTLKVRTGAGSPEGVVSGPVGSLYLRTDGGVTTTLYVKTSGTGRTGWTAK